MAGLGGDVGVWTGVRCKVAVGGRRWGREEKRKEMNRRDLFCLRLFCSSCNRMRSNGFVVNI